MNLNTHPRLPRVLSLIACTFGLVTVVPSAALAQVSFTNTTAYTQAFTTGSNGVNAGTMINTAGLYTWTDNSSITGWYAVWNGSTSASYRATNAGGQNGGSDGIDLFRSSGTSGALGTIRGNSITGLITFGVQIANNTGSTIDNFAVSYIGQQWQTNTGGADALTFQYSTDATSLSTGSWTTVSSLSFNSLADSGTTNNVALSGGTGVLSTSISGTALGLNLASGSNIWFRWLDEDATGVDQALSIDNLSITPALAVPEPSTYAALVGVFSLAIVAIRRRRQARA